jgi:hypothetical protein
MEFPVRSLVLRAALAAQLAGTLLLASCATVARPPDPVLLGKHDMPTSTGRVTFVLTDENGIPMTQIRVDVGWESPQFFRTSRTTDSLGRVTFSGMPEIASVSINHPGGMYTRTLQIPQQGTMEWPVILETYGANEQERARRRGLIPSGH